MFTLQERKVLFFLIFVVVVGIGVDYLNKMYSPHFNWQDFIQRIDDENKFDLNQIDKETLIRMPGIGGIIAERIINYRQQQGGFREIEELKKIKGIRPTVYEKLKDRLYIR